MIRAAEFVFTGHPDKLSDAIADALVQEATRREPRALVGVEVAVHRDEVFITGRIACQDATSIDVESVVRDVYATAGYDEAWFPAPHQVRVRANLCLGPLEDGEAEFREVSDDQAICVGYANDLPQTGWLPPEQWLVREVAQRLHRLRAEQPALQLGPDGKVILVLDEQPLEKDAASGAVRWRVVGLSTSLQQQGGADDVALHRAVRQTVAQALQALARHLPGLSPELPAELSVNGAGAFEVGGPEGDNGLSGKKLVMDAYGPRVPIGGGAWSGKDFYKADRAGGLHARRLALLATQLQLAREATVVLGWFPGDSQARVWSIVDERGVPLPAPTVAALQARVDRSLRRSGDAWTPVGVTPGGDSDMGSMTDLREVARWGHFGGPGEGRSGAQPAAPARVLFRPWEALGTL